VGYYHDRSGSQQGLLLDERSGRWARGVEAALPANASGRPFVQLISVSCASAGNCTAVGNYDSHALLLRERSGTWERGVEPALPANGLGGQLWDVSCVSAGNCTAVGAYGDGSGPGQGLLLDERSGRWKRGVQAALPANASGAELWAVSCASAGNCAATGWYGDSSGYRQGLLLDERHGRWARGVEAALPANAQSNPDLSDIFIGSVSCPSPGNCTAVGEYNNNWGRAGHWEGLLLSESATPPPH
jgi:hypothetical protein